MSDNPSMLDPDASRCPWRTIVFRLEAPQARAVSVVGDFNDWDADKHPMQKNAYGVWEGQMPLPPGRYAYKFVVDGTEQLDPCCQVCEQTADGTECCILKVTSPLDC